MSHIYSSKKLCLIILAALAAFFIPTASAIAEPPVYLLDGQLPSYTGPPVVVKDLSVFPSQVYSTGKARVLVMGTVFTPNENCTIKRVWADMAHTSTFPEIVLKANTGQILTSGEGRYRASFVVDDLAEPGNYRVSILARDSKGATGQAMARFTVEYKSPAQSPVLGSPEFFTVLEGVGGNAFTPGNRVEILDKGALALEKRLEVMEGAIRQINLQSYTFDKDVADGRIMDLLLKKAKQGVEVNIILNAGSQLPTSPAGAFRLEVDQLVGKWVESAEKKLSGNKPGDFVVKNFLSKSPGRGVNVIMVSTKELAGDTPTLADRKGPPDHWLTRLLEERGVISPDRKTPIDLKELFKGPGGLPALPLLDHAVHEKILVVDGEHAIVGGRNLEDRYFDTWTDLDIYIKGPVVAQIQDGFLANYNSMRRSDNGARRARTIRADHQEHGQAKAMFTQSRPWKKDYAAMHALVRSIQASTGSIYITSQFLALPQSLLRDALMDAARRGVDVRILTNSYETAHQLYFSAGYFITLNNMEELLDAGIRIYEKNGAANSQDNPYCHAKEFLFDSKVAAIGSFNLSLRSCFIESENMVFIQDHDLMESREQAFLQEISLRSTEITQDGLAQRKDRYKNQMEIAWYLDLLF